MDLTLTLSYRLNITGAKEQPSRGTVGLWLPKFLTEATIANQYQRESNHMIIIGPYLTVWNAH